MLLSLWRWYIVITTSIIILDIIHSLLFYLKQDVSETGVCLRLQLERTHVDPLDKSTFGDRIQSPKLQKYAELRSLLIIFGLFNDSVGNVVDCTSIETNGWIRMNNEF
jgi:hypothetical protein